MRIAGILSLLTSRRLRAAAIAALLVLPALTLWNLAVKSYAPRLEVRLGRRLQGVTVPRPPLEWSLSSLVNGSLQQGIAAAVVEAFPLRPVLVRFNNSIRSRFFGAYGAPGIVAGARGHLFEEGYIVEYCARDLAKLEAVARQWIPKLRELQDFYSSRGRTFIFIITPSKAAHLPELIPSRYPCTSSETARREWLPVYMRLLRAAGINALDAASLTHSLKGRYELDLFPEGGAHWNMLGVAHAADALLAELNRLAGRPLAPRLSWTYQVTNRATGTDRDLADLINVLIPNFRYPTADVTFAPTAPCASWPAAGMRAALVGGSFMHDLARVLISAGCLSALEGYNYLYISRHGGPGFRILQNRLAPADVLPLREVEILILEENEAAILSRPGHGDELHRVMLGR